MKNNRSERSSNAKFCSFPRDVESRNLQELVNKCTPLALLCGGIPRKQRRGKHMSSAPCDALNLHHSAGSCTFNPSPRRARGQKQGNKKAENQTVSPRKGQKADRSWTSCEETGSRLKGAADEILIRRGRDSVRRALFSAARQHPGRDKL